MGACTRIAPAAAGAGPSRGARLLVLTEATLAVVDIVHARTKRKGFQEALSTTFLPRGGAASPRCDVLEPGGRKPFSGTSHAAMACRLADVLVLIKSGPPRSPARTCLGVTGAATG